MNLKIVLGILLLTCMIVISMPFERGYHQVLADLAHHTGARFMAGIALLLLASYDIVLASMAFIILFLWIADIQLLSSIRFANSK
jgi:hypothetical protein